MTSQCSPVSASPSRAACARAKSSDHCSRSDEIAFGVGLYRDAVHVERVRRGRRRDAVRDRGGRDVSQREPRARARAPVQAGLAGTALPIAARADEGDEARGPVVAPGAAPVRERREHVLRHDAVALAVDAVAAPDPVREARFGRQVLEARIVELVRAHLGAAARFRRPRKRRRLVEHDVAAPDRPLVHHDVPVDRADHPVAVSLPRQRAREVHEPAALGIHGQARVDRGADPLAQRAVGLELAREELGKAAADDQRIDVRQLRVRERVERDERRAGGAQRVEVVRVVEPERAILRDADPDVGGASAAPRRRRLQRGGRRAAEARRRPARAAGRCRPGARWRRRSARCAPPRRPFRCTA